MERVITVVDVTGIQSYIFGSNRLRENIGASQLVEEATTTWIYKSLFEQGRSNITHNRGTYTINAATDESCTAELVYAGGGNTVLLFDSRAHAVAWTQDYTQRVLRDAPGLRVVVAHSDPFAWNPMGTDLPDKTSTLIRGRLAEAKRTRIPSAPLLGLGVTASCQSTGLVASGVDEVDNRRISQEAAAKLNAVSRADKRFGDVFGAYTQRLKYPIPHQFDELGRSRGEQSYLAVVHADGNAMGQLVAQIGANRTNRAYIEAMRAFSDLIATAAKTALGDMLAVLVTPDGLLTKLGADERPLEYLPFRPLVYGGDDVTFVCDGRLGVELAQRYLAAFERETQHLWSLATATIGSPARTLTACAGVAIIKVHYPFARAYALSEDLCKKAKSWMRTLPPLPGNEGLSALDWHIAQSGMTDSLDGLREREYGTPHGSLLMRPVALQRTAHDWRTWPQLAEVVQQLRQDWGDRRGKVVQLREILRAGPDKTAQFLRLEDSRADRPVALPRFDGAGVQETLALNGWLHAADDQARRAGVCGYFDAIELLDFTPDDSLGAL